MTELHRITRYIVREEEGCENVPFQDVVLVHAPDAPRPYGFARVNVGAAVLAHDVEFAFSADEAQSFFSFVTR